MERKKIALLAVLACVLILGSFASCDKNEESLNSMVTKNDERQVNTSSDVAELRAAGKWGNYLRLHPTGNKTVYFSRGEYAAKIYRHWWNGGLKTLVRAVQAPEGSGVAYCSVTKYDGDGNVLESYGPTMLDESNCYPFGSSTIDISGDEYLVIILDVRDSGYYMCMF